MPPLEPTGEASPSTAYRLTLRYDGRPYYGWQRHQGKPTVQGRVEAAIEELFGAKCALHGSGRTDRGVHADAQVAHFTAPFDLDPSQVLRGLQDLLREELELLACDRVTSDFHAREDAVAKIYRYEIWNAPSCPPQRLGRVWHVPKVLDFEAMRAAAPILVGEHDFASFVKKTNFQQHSTVRDLNLLELRREDALLVMRFRADGFLYKMVRNLVRALVKVGEGRTSAELLRTILQACDRKAAPGTAPASGLFLESVEYAAPVEASET